MQVYPLKVQKAWAEAAACYHDGQWSGLYSLASTEQIHDWNHVQRLKREIAKLSNLPRNDCPLRALLCNDVWGAVYLLWDNDIGVEEAPE